MTSLTHENSSSATISAETYTWDDAGNLTAKTVDSNDWSYSYDDDDQLTEEEAPSFTASYSYDANGNRAFYTVGGVTQTYNVDDGDKLNSITSGGVTVKSYTYDSAGRTTSVTTSAGTTTLSYDYEDRITGITYPSTATNSFSYNGLDTRVGKTDSSGTYSYVRDGADVTAPLLDDGAANYTPGVSQHRSGTTTFENEDYLGTSTRQTNSSETTTATRSYDAFGNLVSTTGTPIGPFGFVGKAGYQEDGDSGLKLLGHRYYDPSTGRFLTRDTVKDGRNWYAYCDSNPVKQSDPYGLQKDPNAWWQILLKEIPPIQGVGGGKGTGNQQSGGGGIIIVTSLPPPQKLPKGSVTLGPFTIVQMGGGKGGAPPVTIVYLPPDAGQGPTTVVYGPGGGQLWPPSSKKG